METSKRMGPPRGNQNARKHGLGTPAAPKGCATITQSTNAVARALLADVMKIKGVVSVTDAALVQSAARWERHGLLAAR